MEALAIPLPRLEITPPVINMNFDIGSILRESKHEKRRFADNPALNAIVWNNSSPLNYAT
jgi:hypothetical protein